MENYIIESIKEISNFKSANAPILFLVGGGSVTVRLISQVPTDFFDSQVTLTVTDERFTRDKNQHNFSQLLLLANIQSGLKSGLNLIDTTLLPEDKIPMDLTRRFELGLNEWKSNNPTGKIIAAVGMGSDGHTLGIFPDSDQNNFTQKFLLEEKIVVGYDAGGNAKVSSRVTVTLCFMEKVDKIFFFFEGESKREAFNKIKDKSTPINLAPAKFIYNLPQTTVFTDLL